MKKISDKKLKALGGKLPFSTISAPKKAVRKKPRSKSEFQRIYGSEERLSWVTRQPCAACGREASDRFPSHNHHVRTGGTSRKGDHTTIVPLCSRCHGAIHKEGRYTFEAAFGVDLTRLAAETEAAWQSRISEREE